MRVEEKEELDYAEIQLLDRHEREDYRELEGFNKAVEEQEDKRNQFFNTPEQIAEQKLKDPEFKKVLDKLK